MADYFQHHDTRVVRTRASSAHSDHTGLILTGVALLMMALLALVWTGQENISPLPQPAPAAQAQTQAQVQTVQAADPAPAPAPVVLRAAPVIDPPASDVIAAAGDTRAVQP